MKECKHCNTVKPTNEFHTKTSAADGLFPYCKNCRRLIGGYTRRQPPKIAQPTSERLQKVVQTLSNIDDTEYAQIVAETLTNAEHPALKKKRNVRKSAETLERNPEMLTDPFTSWDEQQENMADMLFEAWDKRQKQDVQKYMDLNERLPIITPKKAKRHAMAELNLLNMLFEDNYHDDCD